MSFHRLDPLVVSASVLVYSVIVYDCLPLFQNHLNRFR